MKLTVEYSAQLKQIVGCASEMIETDKPCTIRTLVRHLAERHGDSFRTFVLNENELIHPTLLFAVNDEQVDPREDLPLHENDRIGLYSPIAGG